jgi:hypothetical protein
MKWNSHNRLGAKPKDDHANAMKVFWNLHAAGQALETNSMLAPDFRETL